MDPQNFNFKKFKPPPVKVKTGRGGSIAKYALSGIAFALIDKLSEKLFESPQNNNAFNFQKYYKKQNQSQQEKNSYLPEETQNQVKYSRKHLQEKIQKTDLNSQQETVVSQPFSSRDTMFQNFLYGFFFSHLGSMFQQKVHLNLLKFKIPPYMKFFLITPFAMLPYYYMMGMSDQLQIEDINDKVKRDFFGLAILRSFGDYFAYFLIPKLQPGITGPNMTSVQQLNSLGGKGKGLLIGHKVLRGVFIFGMISLYNERINPKKSEEEEEEERQKQIEYENQQQIQEQQK